MKIDKIYNNNVVQVINQDGQEVVLMGKGLGFGKKVGDSIDPDLIEKTFVPENTATAHEWYQIYGALSADEIDVILQIIHLAEVALGQVFELTSYLSLADHLHYAIERTQQGISLQNPLVWEIRKFYPTEYQLGKEAIAIVSEKLGIQLGDDEAASLALHYVNAQKDSGLVNKNYQTTQIVMGILEIVRLYFGQDTMTDDNSIAYNRFVTHVNYFAQRVVNGLVQGNNDAFLYEQVKVNYPQAYACTQKIKAYIHSHHNFIMSQDEEVYLTIHIQRVVSQ